MKKIKTLFAALTLIILAGGAAESSKLVTGEEILDQKTYITYAKDQFGNAVIASSNFSSNTETLSERLKTFVENHKDRF